MHAKVDPVRKIAVLRANALGDYIFALPALDALRAAYPQAQITLLGKSWHQSYLDGRPGPVDRVIVIPRYKGVGEDDAWGGPNDEEQAVIDGFFTRMEAEHFDLALQMHGGGGNSNPFVARLGARVTAGSRAAGAPPLDRWITYYYWQHEIMRLLEVAALVGAEPVNIEPHITVTPRDLREACQVVPDDEETLVVLHPGASDPRRRWSAERFARAGDALVKAGCRVALVGIPEERAVVDAVLDAMEEPAMDLCGRLSLHGLTGLLSRAAMVVANDSGPRHLAEAVGTPTVSIFWCGNVINAGPAFRAKHRPHLSWTIHCPVCGKNTIHEGCDHRVSFVDEVRVEAVVEAAMDLLKESKGLRCGGVSGK